MMNQHRTLLHPGPACASVAPLVALVVGQQPLDPQDAQTLHAHLETCAYCQSELEEYRRLDGAFARHFALPTSDPLSPGEINAILDETYQPAAKPPARALKPVVSSAPRPLPASSAAPRWRGPRFISALSALAAVVLITAVGLALFVSHTPTTPGQPATPSPTPTPGTRYVPQPKDTISSIDMLSASDGWAVGSRFVSVKISDTLILHYNGSYWEQVSSPTHQDLQGLFLGLNKVAMVSPTEGWATGTYSSSTTHGSFAFILHYTGGRWAMQEQFPDIELSGLAMLSASDGWAIGDGNSFSQGVLLHYTGGVWHRLASFGTMLTQIAMLSPSDGWMVGALSSGASAAWHYDGFAWTQVNIPVMNLVQLIAPVSASDVWAFGLNPASPGAGNALSSGGTEPVFAHYDGKTWTAVQTPVSGKQDVSIASLFMDAASDGWAIGISALQSSGGITGDAALYLHYTGGHWQVVNGPSGVSILGVFMLSASDGWAVGDGGTILHYQRGAWAIVVSNQ